MFVSYVSENTRWREEEIDHFVQYFLTDKRSSEVTIKRRMYVWRKFLRFVDFWKTRIYGDRKHKAFVYFFTEMTRNLVEHRNVYERSGRTINPEWRFGRRLCNNPVNRYLIDEVSMQGRRSWSSMLIARTSTRFENRFFLYLISLFLSLDEQFVMT